MKRTIALVFAALLVFSGMAHADLIAHYAFDGNAVDATGSGNDGIVYGAAKTVDRYGNPDSAYHFDGVNDYIAFNHNPLFSTWNDNFSVSLWLKMDSVSYPAKWALFFGNDKKGTTAGESLGIFVIDSLTLNDVLSGIQVYDMIDQNVRDTTRVSTAGYDSWYNLTAVMSDATLCLYLNGRLVSSTETDYDFTEADGDNFTIGALKFDDSYLDFIHGDMDDVRIYNHALTLAEIQSISGAPVPEPATMLLLGSGLLGLAGARRRFKK